MSARADALIQVNDLTKEHPGPPPVWALHPCSFVIQRGDYVALTGPSGSGKTTLLSLLATLERQTGGTYFFDGNDTSQLDDRELSSFRAHNIGMVFQAFHLLSHLTVIDNVRLSMRYQGVDPKEQRARTLSAIAQVGLERRQTAMTAHLSGGEKQRVAIARTIAQQPAVVLCDEPTGNLDSVGSGVIMDLLGEMNQRGTTVVVVTHDLAIAGLMSRRLEIHDGWVTDGSGTTRPSLDPTFASGPELGVQ